MNIEYQTYNKPNPVFIPNTEDACQVCSGIDQHETENVFCYGDTFAMPSHKVMPALLPLFAGKPTLIPRKLLMRTQEDCTVAEWQEVTSFMDSIYLDPEIKETYDENGIAQKEESRIAIISDNSKIEAKVDITSLLQGDFQTREKELAMYIKKTFGAEGLRHILGLIIGLEENFRQGYFNFTINEHLERLQLKRTKKGSYDPKAKETARNIIRIISELFITISEKKGNKERIKGQRLFSIDGFDLKRDSLTNKIFEEGLTIRACDFWYHHGFKANTRSPQYTKLLKKIAGENHRTHPLTLFLSPLFAIFWRIKPGSPKKLRIGSVMEWCDLDHSTANRNRMRELRDLESEFDYMVDAGYLGQWNNSKGDWLPSECDNPFDCVVEFCPPKWLETSFVEICNKKTQAGHRLPEFVITQHGLKKLLHETGLSQREFAKRLGVSRTMINQILNGRKSISRKLAGKVRDVFGEGSEDKVLTKPCPLRCETLPSQMQDPALSDASVFDGSEYLQ